MLGWEQKTSDFSEVHPRLPMQPPMLQLRCRRPPRPTPLRPLRPPRWGSNVEQLMASIVSRNVFAHGVHAASGTVCQHAKVPKHVQQ
eukprot:15474602-Alexandrium_andersonii.AAC.1